MHCAICSLTLCYVQIREEYVCVCVCVVFPKSGKFLPGDVIEKGYLANNSFF